MRRLAKGEAFIVQESGAGWNLPGDPFEQGGKQFLRRGDRRDVWAYNYDYICHPAGADLRFRQQRGPTLTSRSPM